MLGLLRVTAGAVMSQGPGTVLEGQLECVECAPTYTIKVEGELPKIMVSDMSGLGGHFSSSINLKDVLELINRFPSL